MATTVTAATLTATITESLIIGGQTYGNTIKKEVVSQGEAYQRILSCPTALTNILTLGTADAGGTIVGDNMAYCRVTNLDDTNYVEVTFIGTTQSWTIKLDAGDSIVIQSNQMNAVASVTPGAVGDYASISAKANGAICDIELLAITS